MKKGIEAFVFHCDTYGYNETKHKPKASLTGTITNKSSQPNTNAQLHLSKIKQDME